MPYLQRWFCFLWSDPMWPITDLFSVGTLTGLQWQRSYRSQQICSILSAACLSESCGWQRRLAVRVKIGLGRDSVDSLDSSVVRPKHGHGNPERRNHIQIRFRRRTAATPHGKTAVGDEITERSENHAATKPRLQLPRHCQSHVQTQQLSRLKPKSLEGDFIRDNNNEHRHTEIRQTMRVDVLV